MKVRTITKKYFLKCCNDYEMLNLFIDIFNSDDRDIVIEEEPELTEELKVLSKAVKRFQDETKISLLLGIYKED